MSLPSSLRLKDSNNLPSSLRLKQQPRDYDIPSDESIEKDIERSTARSTSRIGESILGAPGDLFSFVRGLFGLEQNILPTSSQLKGLSESVTQGYTKPQNEFEESVDEIASDFGSMSIGGPGKNILFKSIGIPIIGNLAKQGLKYSNADEKSQAYGKMGTMIAMDLASNKGMGVKKYISSLYQQAEKSIPKGSSVNASKLSKSLDNLQQTLSAGGSQPSTSKALTKINELKSEINNGKIGVDRLAAFRPSINEIIDEVGGFSFEVPFKSKPKAIRNLNLVKDEVIKNLNEYGEKFNPEFNKFNKAANEAFAAKANSEKISKFLQDKIGYLPKSKAMQSLFSYGPAAASIGGALLNPVGATGALASLGAYQGIKLLSQIKNSPTLAKYYGNVLKYAAKRNLPQTIKSMNELEEGLESQKLSS